MTFWCFRTQESNFIWDITQPYVDTLCVLFKASEEYWSCYKLFSYFILPWIVKYNFEVIYKINQEQTYPNGLHIQSLMLEESKWVVEYLYIFKIITPCLSSKYFIKGMNWNCATHSIHLIPSFAFKWWGIKLKCIQKILWLMRISFFQSLDSRS